MRFLCCALLFVLGACGGGDPPPVQPQPVALSIAPSTFTLAIGESQQFTAAVTRGGQPLTGRPVTWSTGAATVASIDGSGVVTAISPGTATISARSEGATAEATVTVVQPAVAQVAIAASFITLSTGQTGTLSATTLDARGNVLSGRPVTWTSSQPAVATVSAAGLVTALAAGISIMTATSEGASGTFTANIFQQRGPPAIVSLTPATITAGTSLTIIGTGFDPVVANNTVSIGGATAPITSATATTLVVMVPCVESGNTSVRVTTNGMSSAVRQVAMTVAPRTLPVGGSLIIAGSSAGICNELITATSGNARYLVTVFSASTSANTLVDFELGGNTPQAGAPALQLVAAPTAAMQLPAKRDEEADRDAAHWRMLERNRADYERLRAVARAAPRTPARAMARVALPSIGDARDLFFTFSGGCSDTARVMHSKAVYVGSRAIIWEDSANVLQSSGDAALAGYYQRLGQIFDADQYESVKRTFGDPLLRDAVTDGDGRVHMVFSQRVNGTGAAAYVTSCDQFPVSQSAGSNFGQFLYGIVPTTSGSNLANTAVPDGWFNFMGRTVVHELKHVASLSARVANDAPAYEQSWLEEGTARHAEEMWVRESLHHTEWKTNLGFGTPGTNGIYCDFLPSDGACLSADPLRRPSYGMRRHFNELRDKLVQPWNWSPYGEGTGQTGAVFYQTAWSLVRYTIDRYATSDAAFFRALVNASTNGTTNLAAVAGVPIEQLIGGWGMALYADDYPGLAAPSADIQFPSWNLRSIYAGLNASPSWTSRFPTAFPVQPVSLSFGPFISRVTGLRGGAHAYFELSGAALPIQLLNVRGLNGSVPSTNLRVAIARLQ